MFEIFIFFFFFKIRSSRCFFPEEITNSKFKKKIKIHLDRDTFYFENNSWRECQKKKKKRRKKNEITNEPNF